MVVLPYRFIHGGRMIDINIEERLAIHHGWLLLAIS